KKVTDIYSINVDGTGLVNWTNDVEGPELDFNGNYRPVWAPDGASIYFSRSNATYFCRVDRGGYDDIYTANTLQRISTPGGSPTPVVDNPSWRVFGGSAYGGSLAYVRGNLPGGPDGGYCASEPEEKSYVVLDGDVVGEGDWSPPRWSPDGTQLYFGGEDSVRSVPAVGGAATTLFAGRSPDVGPAYAGADDRIPTSLVLGFKSAGSCTPSGCKTTGIDAKGTLQPKHSGSTVSVRLDAYRKGAWRKIGVRTPTTDKFGRYQAGFGRPRGSVCRLTASFAGDKTYLPSQLVRRLAC
ncbi:MAG TPA: hypothetical protein VFN19_04320, partial [Candidatus Nanopelagicales bacterium]|nr:hypothetical protein [Candidatus Nanopelagicales bacterium]